MAKESRMLSDCLCRRRLMQQIRPYRTVNHYGLMDKASFGLALSHDYSSSLIYSIALFM